MRSIHVSEVIACPPSEVYAVASDPDRLPEWASGLAQSKVKREGDVLVAESPMGRVEVEFVATNDLGVIDHDVTLPSGDVVNNPVRVLAHPDGSEVLFTIRQLEMTDEELEHDATTVREDLQRLKALLEGTVLEGPGHERTRDERTRDEGR